MKIISKRVYKGPNLYAHFRVMRMTVDLGPLEQAPSSEIPGFVDALLENIPSLHSHGCSYREEGGFVRRLREGTWMGHILEHVALELQCLAGTEVTFGKTRGTGETGVYDVVYEYEEARVGEAAGRLAMDLLHHLIPAELRPGVDTDPDFVFEEELEGLIRRAKRQALGPSTSALVKAAEERDIPWIRLNEYSLIQFGHGIHQQRIQATITSETRHIAVEIASDKEETNRILTDLGLPVPRQELVYSERAAVRAAERIGYPVVVKPLNANHGRGVSTNMTDRESVRTAYEQAREHSRGILVESFIQGMDHRMLVINGELIAVAKRVPGHIVGDGKHTIEELIDIVNSDPRRGIGHEKVLTRLELDSQAQRLIENAGLTPESILPEGEPFFLRTTGNLSTGGEAIDLTDVVHPENREMAIRSAEAIGLDVAGIDFLTPDITRSYKEVGGAICEVNAAPGFRMHVAPSAGTPRDVAGPVVDMLFPNEKPSRIPIASITGTNGKTTTTRMLGHIHKIAGEFVGMTTSDGVYFDGRRAVEGDMTGPTSAQIVLRSPQASVAILETARGGLLRAGLGYKRPNVACCLNVAEDHLGMKGIDTLEQLAEIKRIPIEVASDAIVLNADDPLCLQMADYSKAREVWYATMDPGNTLVREHIRAGGRAIGLENGFNGQMISIYDNGAHIPLLWTHLIPATLEGKALFNVQNAMFAAAMAYAMGISLDNIRLGLRTFDTTFFQAPGRMNIFDEHPFRVILDYGHNPAAVQALSDMVDSMTEGDSISTGARKVCVLAAPGDRRDQDIEAIANIAASSFDYFFCRRDDKLRGRGPNEVPELLQKTLLAAGVSEDRIQVIPDEQEATKAALQFCKEGDLLLVFGDNISRTWKQIIYFGGRTPSNDPGSQNMLMSGQTIPRNTSTASNRAHVRNPSNPSPITFTPQVDESVEWEMDGMSLIRDERGVRVVRQDSESND
ncbi:MAG: cyanophycin synthetase [Deltaproteobacteria bacterium]|nr:MAG: cyanophycin synthetase [Deltaproteobacteria bacterium]